jgi:hypothetical protein
MEMSQGNQCIAMLNKQKCHFKKKHRTGGQKRSCLGDQYQWEGEAVWGEGVGE